MFACIMAMYICMYGCMHLCIFCYVCMYCYVRMYVCVCTYSNVCMERQRIDLAINSSFHSFASPGTPIATLAFVLVPLASIWVCDWSMQQRKSHLHVQKLRQSRSAYSLNSKAMIPHTWRQQRAETRNIVATWRGLNTYQVCLFGMSF